MVRRILLIVEFALLVPCLAMARTVSYTTSGTFSNPSLFPIMFTPAPPAMNFVGGDVSFGLFTVGGCPTAMCTGSETFTLQISQSSPPSGTADLVGTISGEVLHNGFTDLKISFTTATVTISGTTTYTIPFMHSINFSTTTLNGTVLPEGPIPEPSAAFLLGIGALGLMGLATVSPKNGIKETETKK